MKTEELKLRPIGSAHKTQNSGVMRIDVFPEYSEGLDKIQELENIVVYYWMHKLEEEDRRRLKVHPRGDEKRPLTGVFALRSPVRPNPIGETKVRLIRREENRLFVKELDAFEGSPVIDIKHP